MSRRVKTLLRVTGILICVQLAQLRHAAADTTVWDGIYTFEQATRGQALFAAKCAQCHGSNLRGGPTVPSLVGPAFRAFWGGKLLSDLLEDMRATMPPGQGGSLPEQAYVDMLAVVLLENGYPPGSSVELIPQSPLLKEVGLPATPVPPSDG